MPTSISIDWIIIFVYIINNAIHNMIFINNYIIILFKNLFAHISNVPMNHFIKTYILMIIFVR